MSVPEYKLKSERLNRFELPTGALGLAVHSDQRRAFTACIDGVYELWLDSGRLSKLYDHDSYVSNVVFVPALEQIVSSGYDGALKWFDLNEQRVIRGVKAHQFWSWDLAVSAEAQLVASSTGQYLAGDYAYRPLPSNEPCVRIFDAVSGEVVSEHNFGPPAQAVALSPDGRHVAAGNLMGDVGVWKVGGEAVTNWNTPDFTAFGIIKSHCQIGGIYAAAFAPDNSLVVAGMGPMRDPMAGNGKQRWQRFSWASGEAEKVSQSNDDQVGEGLMETLAFHPSGKYFVMGGRLRGGSWNTALIDFESGELVQSMKTDSRVTKACFSGDGTQLLISGAINQSGNAEKQFGVVDVYSLDFLSL